MPKVPGVPALPLPLPRRPWNLMLRIMTTSVAAAATVIPGVPDTKIEATWPPPPSMRDRLGNSQSAKAARIERVNFAARGGLGYGARKRLARRGAAARIGVVADARNPRAGCLGAGRRTGQDGRDDAERGEQQYLLPHGDVSLGKWHLHDDWQRVRGHEAHLRRWEWYCRPQRQKRCKPFPQIALGTYPACQKTATRAAKIAADTASGTAPRRALFLFRSGDNHIARVRDWNSRGT